MLADLCMLLFACLDAVSRLGLRLPAGTALLRLALIPVALLTRRLALIAVATAAGCLVLIPIATARCLVLILIATARCLLLLPIPPGLVLIPVAAGGLVLTAVAAGAFGLALIAIAVPARSGVPITIRPGAPVGCALATLRHAGVGAPPLRRTCHAARRLPALRARAAPFHLFCRRPAAHAAATHATLIGGLGQCQ